MTVSKTSTHATQVAALSTDATEKAKAGRIGSGNILCVDIILLKEMSTVEDHFGFNAVDALRDLKRDRPTRGTAPPHAHTICHFGGRIRRGDYILDFCLNHNQINPFKYRQYTEKCGLNWKPPTRR